SYDFLQLHEQENCTLQLGGSDPWGNITAGLEFIRRSRGEEEIKAFGLTVPLITKADGTKFGKTAGGAICLDPETTRPYELYQFSYKTDDRDVVKFLNYFTFREQEETANLANEVENNQAARQAQKRLSEEMTKMVHSETALE